MAAKYREIATELAARIRRGDLARRDRLPGELELAREFAVSRGTVRQALVALKQTGMIETATGAGSYVTFDAGRIDDGIGWTVGPATTSTLVALARTEPTGPHDTSVLVVERLRSTAAGVPIGLVRSRIPWRSSLETVLATGLVDGSLQATLAAHGLLAASGHESVGLALLTAPDAALLRRHPGEPFLETERTVYDAFGDVIEDVTSLLDPDHHRLRHTFGGAR
jgi:GntR family transcriptional regulator